MKKPCDSSETMYCSDKLMNAASNRYRLVEQVTSRAKRRRYEELDNFEDTTIKPVVRAIKEMCDEVRQLEIIGEDNKYNSYSSSSHLKKHKLNSNSSSSTNTPSNFSLGNSSSGSEDVNSNSASCTDTLSKSTAISQTHTNHLDNKNCFLNHLRNDADTDAWNSLTEWINSSMLDLDLDAAKNSAITLKKFHSTEDPLSAARTLIVLKSLQAAAVDLTRSIPHAEEVISSLTEVELSTLAKLCTEMVYQIAVIYNMDFRISEQQAEILTVFGLALIGERAIEAGIGWLKRGNLTSIMLSASAKALMIYAVGHAACIYYQNKSLELAKLRNASQNYLKGITNESAVEDLIEHEIENEFSIDYSKLKEYLKKNKWKRADRETGLIIRSMCSWTGYDINNYSIAELPRDEIKKIDKLWYQYSNGRFGFEVQKQIYEQVGKDIERFGTEVNWRGEPGLFDGAFSWNSYNQITFDNGSVKGHLPAFWFDIAPGLSMTKGKIKNSLGVLLERNDISF